MSRLGHVTLVGSGPGDPGLLTLAAVRAIGQADAIVYDALAPAAALRHARPDAELHDAGKRAGMHALDQDQINALLVSLASSGKRVVRLKGGDPFVFGRGAEEALACRQAGVPFAVVPGVSSALAAPAYAGIPVTHRHLAENVLILTAHEAGQSATTDWAFAARAHTLVILMGAASLAANMASLIAAGKPPDTPVTCVRWGTRPDQQVVTGTLATIAAHASAAGLAAPLATIVGPVAAFASELAWFEPGPLAGRRVAVTRARSDSSELAARLEALGATVVELPTITIRPPSDPSAIATALAGGGDWLIVTSRHAVDAVFRALFESGSDARALAGFHIAAIGAATAAALEAHGLRADFLPSRATSAALAAELPARAGERVILPLSSLADGRLELALQARGCLTHRVTAYETTSEPLTPRQRLDVIESDVITFTSASTARNLRAALGGASLPPAARLVTIGERTSEAAREAFGRVDREAATPSLDALVDAVVQALQ